MKKITSKKMMNYGAMSAAILATAAAAGQNVYTDIDDTVVGYDDDAFAIDLNADGEIDFTINIAGATGGTAFVAYPGIQDAENNGAFVGMAAGNYQYPALLAADQIIDTSSSTTDIATRGDLNFYGCAYSNSEFCGTMNDAYLGLIFDFEGNTHYGWVRMDFVINSADTDTFTVKDFAFNATPEAPVTVGDDTLNTEDQAFENFSYAVNNGSLNLVSQTAMSNVTIFDINGRQVLDNALSNTNESVELSTINTGVYIARVSIDGATRSFKFVK